MLAIMAFTSYVASKRAHMHCAYVEMLPFSILQELLLQNQISDLTERLAVAGSEMERLREEREELQYQVRYMHDVLAAKTGVRVHVCVVWLPRTPAYCMPYT